MISLSLLISAGMAHAQVIESGTFRVEFRLKKAKDSVYNPLDEVVVSAYRTAEKRQRVIQEIDLIPTAKIQQSLGSSTVDVLATHASIAIQKSQQGGGSIILRGMEANRVLLVVDGIRMNNLIYRSGHLQNAITVDPLSLDRIEVSFGPTSNAYGSDALGGVVHFMTKTPKFTGTYRINGQMLLKTTSVNNGKVSHVEVKASGKRLASLTTLTQSAFGDLRSGRKINPSYGLPYGERRVYQSTFMGHDSVHSNPDPWLQVGSSYTQNDLLHKTLWRFRPGRVHQVNIQVSTSSNVMRYDRLTDKEGFGPLGRPLLKYAEWYYGPQDRSLFAYKYKGRDQWGFDGVNVTAYKQVVQESRMTRKFNNPYRNYRIEDVVVWGFNADGEKRWQGNVLRAGIDGSIQGVQSNAFKQHVMDAWDQRPIDSRYPGGVNQMKSLAVFATHVNEINEHLTLSEGFRVGLSQLYSEFTDSTFFPFPFQHINQAMPVASGSMGMIYSPHDRLKYTVSATTGFRAPNIDDVAKVFNTSPGRIIVPNPYLRPEQAFTLELSKTKVFDKGSNYELHVFSTSLTDALVIQPSGLYGSDSIVYNGEMSQVLSQSNMGHAYLLGFSASAMHVFSREWKAEGNMHLVKGRMLSQDMKVMPMDHIPPMTYKASLNYTKGIFRADLFLLGAGWKHIDEYLLTGEDNARYATPVGMPSWQTVNMHLSMRLKQGWYFQSGIQNIADLQYRTFASGINAAGRNLIFSIRYTF